MSAILRPEDKRRSERRVVSKPMRVSEFYGRQPLGNLINLSRQGFMLISKAAVAADAVVRMVMELPEAVEGVTSVSFEARCVWCQKSSYSDDYGAGFEISRISPEDQRRLEAVYGEL